MEDIYTGKKSICQVFFYFVIKWCKIRTENERLQ